MTWVRYRSHKIVEAAPITRIAREPSVVLYVGEAGEEVFTPNVAEMAERAKLGDYAVRYADGYKSVSPKQAFDDGYVEAE